MTRKVSLLEEAGRTAQRELLLKTLGEHAWSLSRTAEALGLQGNLVRWVRYLGLVEAYKTGRASVGKTTRIDQPRPSPKEPESRWTQVPMFGDEPPAE